MRLEIYHIESRRKLIIEADNSISFEDLSSAIVEKLNLQLFDPFRLSYQRYYLYLRENNKEIPLEPNILIRERLQGGETLVIKGVGSESPVSNSEYGLATLHIQNSWSIQELNYLLGNLERSYNNFFVFNEILLDRKQNITNYNLVRQHQTIESSMNKGEKLLIHKISINSPGIIALIGALNPLESIRQYLKDRQQAKLEERKLNIEEQQISRENEKDKSYRIAVEKAKAMLEIESLKNKVIKEKIALLKDAGFSQEEVRPYIEDLLRPPLNNLQNYQAQGKMEFTEITSLGMQKMDIIEDIDNRPTLPNKSNSDIIDAEEV